MKGAPLAPPGEGQGGQLPPPPVPAPHDGVITIATIINHCNR